MRLRIFSALTATAIAATSFIGTSQASASEADFSGNLSVVGNSQVSMPADQAVIVLTYYPDSYYSADYSDPSTASSPQVQPADLKTVADALAAAGVPADRIKAFPDPTSPGSIRVRLMLDQPTQARLEQLVNTANTALTKTNRYMSSGAVVGYTIDDCNAIESQARQAAMTDAQNRANALAEAANTRLGRISSLSESVSWGSTYTSVCPASNDPSIYSDYYSLPAYDPSLPPVVKVLYSLSATYEMQ